MDQILVDREFSKRLERTEGSANASFVEARQRLQPEVGAAWKNIAGTYVMFDGVASPLTQTFGLGMFEPCSDAVLDQIEAFYQQHGATVCHEVSPMTATEDMLRLGERGYRPIELTAILYKQFGKIEIPLIADTRLVVRAIDESRTQEWARAAAKGWEANADFEQMIFEFSLITAERDPSLAFFVEIDGQIVATGAMFLSEKTALLAGASTIPQWRNLGAQRALLNHRLKIAQEMGCDLAMMGALPGSGSQRNAQRQGFQIAYTRTKWQLHR